MRHALIKQDINADRAILSSVFLARVELAKLSESEAVADAAEDHSDNLLWFGSNVKGKGTFVWFCEQLGLEPTAVRKELL